jgi:hypothetical protein
VSLPNKLNVHEDQLVFDGSAEEAAIAFKNAGFNDISINQGESEEDIDIVRDL